MVERRPRAPVLLYPPGAAALPADEVVSHVTIHTNSHMTNGQIEVITSVERRRWSAAEKRRLVAATLEAGASVSAIAREAGISRGQLYGWRRKSRGPWQIGYSPVRVAADSAPAQLTDAGAIEIEFATGARLRITAWSIERR
jgi:transposase